MDVDFWVSFSDDDLLFLLNRGYFFYLLRFLVLGFLFLFVFLVKSEIVTRLFFGHVVDLGLIEFLSEGIGGGSVCFHSGLELIKIRYSTGEDISDDVLLQIIKIFGVGGELIFSPLFIGGFA